MKKKKKKIKKKKLSNKAMPQSFSTNKFPNKMIFDSTPLRKWLHD